jgi:putative ABC transport system substrate-binding protein
MRQDKSLKLALETMFVAISVVLASASLVRGQPAHVRVAVLTPGVSLTAVHEGLQEGLARLGYVKDKNVTFIIEDTKGDSSDTADLAARAATLLSAKPDVLVAVSTAHAQTAKQATSSVAIVFAWVGDPVKAGLIASYPYSKANLTGVAAIGDSLTGKRLEVFLEIAPKARRLLVVVAPQESIGPSSFRSLEKAAKKFGVKLLRRDVTSEEEIKKVIEETPKGSIDAIFHLPSTLVRTHIDLLVKKAKRDRIPLAVHEDALVDRGAVVSYGPNTRLVGIQVATLVFKALKGTRPGEIMVENPDRFFLAINRGAAKEIGLRIPPGIMERADRLVD